MDCAVQTDPAEFPYWDDLDSLPKHVKKPYTSLTKRLLLRCQRDRRRLEAHQSDGLKVPNEAPNIHQEPFSSSVVQPATRPPTNGDAKTTPEDSKTDAENTLVLSPKHLSFNVPLEKPRPPGQTPNSSDQAAHIAQIKVPPLPSPPQESQLPPTSPHSNGICSVDLPVQSALPQQVSEESATKSVGPGTTSFISTRSPAVQTSNINHISLPTTAANIANIANIPQPSPVRKKLSVAEYFKLVNTNKTETLPAPDSQTVSSPVLQPSTPKTAIKSDVQVARLAATNSGATPGSKREDDDPPYAGKDPKL